MAVLTLRKLSAGACYFEEWAKIKDNLVKESCFFKVFEAFCSSNS